MAYPPFIQSVTGPRPGRIVLACALLVSLGACGYKGPLYLPPPPDPDTTLTNPPALSGNLDGKPQEAAHADAPAR